ncbi:histidine kinase [Geobacter sulfurreducens subsp. ethanolicus]|uniref:histidine kinase n=1 Tax=Geobacter sulfurreducens TaxID=35554 RepID=UPI0025732CDE|nr:histidine kinase [Geobacter sulfurreducens]BEH11826.1 histidine kinase [Geobacter sulfurreducens subsp. ethanolicus]
MKKKIFAVAAAGALTAATAVPALALDNEFHGMFRVNGFISNFADGGSGATRITAQDPKTRNFLEQRARLLYMAKANDDLKLITHFEIDSTWGKSSYVVGRSNDGGALGADSVNIETKNVYLDFNIPSTPLNVKVGIQPISDSYKGVFINADAAAVLAAAKMGDATVALGFARLDDAEAGTGAFPGTRGSATTPGKATRDLYIVDGKYNISKDLKVGGSYYALLADQNDTNLNFALHTVGVNAEYKFDPVTIDGFLLYQRGRTSGTAKVDFGGWAANATAKMKVGPGTLKTSFLYASGEQNANPDNSSYMGITNETSAANGEHSFYESEMMIMFRNKYNIGDRALVYNVQNVIGGFVGYNANITSKAFAIANVGFVAADKDNNTYGNARVTGDAGHKSKYLGTELNAEVGYKVFDNLTASVQGAYVILGDYFKDTAGTAANPEDPRNPYLTRVMLNYAF